MAAKVVPLHDMMKPLAWLLGRWTTEAGHGHFPTIADFKYKEELEFFHCGQPNIQFTFYAYDAASNKPLHREVGFLRLKPDSNRIAFVCAQNLGVAEVEEGELNGEELILKSHTVGRLSFGKDPETKQVNRTFRRTGDKLEQIVEMATSNTPLTEHLRTSYDKAA